MEERTSGLYLRWKTALLLARMRLTKTSNDWNVPHLLWDSHQKLRVWSLSPSAWQIVFLRRQGTVCHVLYSDTWLGDPWGLLFFCFGHPECTLLPALVLEHLFSFPPTERRPCKVAMMPMIASDFPFAMGPGPITVALIWWGALRKTLKHQGVVWWTTDTKGPSLELNKRGRNWQNKQQTNCRCPQCRHSCESTVV